MRRLAEALLWVLSWRARHEWERWAPPVPKARRLALLAGAA